MEFQQVFRSERLRTFDVFSYDRWGKCKMGKMNINYPQKHINLLSPYPIRAFTPSELLSISSFIDSLRRTL